MSSLWKKAVDSVRGTVWSPRTPVVEEQNFYDKTETPMAPPSTPSKQAVTVEPKPEGVEEQKTSGILKTSGKEQMTLEEQKKTSGIQMTSGILKTSGGELKTSGIQMTSEEQKKTSEQKPKKTVEAIELQKY